MLLSIALLSIVLLSVALCVSSRSVVYGRHDIHISFGKAELKGDLFEAKLTIYKDDLLRAISTWHIGGYTGMDADQFHQLELRYITNFFRVWENGLKQLTLRSTTTREEDASITFDLVYTLPVKASSITLDSRILFKEYVDQTNVLVLDAFGEQVNHVFTSSSPTFYCKPEQNSR